MALAPEGHFRIVGTKQRPRSKVWWPKIECDAEHYCRTCHGCQLVSRQNPQEPIRSSEMPQDPWQRLAMDFSGPLPSGDSVLVVVECYSCYYEIAVMRTTTSEKTIDVLKEIFMQHGLPISVNSDNDHQFTLSAFVEYMQSVGIEHYHSPPLWPQANGEVERQNNLVEKRMRIAQAEGKDWQTELHTYLAGYCSTPKSVTVVSHTNLLFGREVRT